MGFSLIPGIGRVRFHQMESYFGGLQYAWRAGTADFKQAGLDSASIRAINLHRPKISLEEESEKLERYGVQVLTYHDNEYPSRLKEIYDYPPLLYVRGSLVPVDEWCLAVVGTRRASVYGKQVTEEIVTDLVRSNNLVPQWPLMEDVELSIRLGKFGRRVYLWGSAMVSNYKWQAGFSRRFYKVLYLLSVFFIRKIYKNMDTSDLYNIYYRKTRIANE